MICRNERVEKEKERQNQYIQHMKLMLQKEQLENDLRELERYFKLTIFRFFEELGQTLRVINEEAEG